MATRRGYAFFNDIQLFFDTYFNYCANNIFDFISWNI